MSEVEHSLFSCANITFYTTVGDRW